MSGCWDGGGCAAGAGVGPWGCGTARVRGGTAGLGAASGAWVVLALSWLHISPWDSSSTTAFMGPSASPPPNPSAKAKISTEEAKQILFYPTKTSSRWNASDEIPTVFTGGDAAIHPHIRPTQNVGWSQMTKTETPLFFPHCSW